MLPAEVNKQRLVIVFNFSAQVRVADFFLPCWQANESGAAQGKARVESRRIRAFSSTT
jgi:hypothetical protein